MSDCVFCGGEMDPLGKTWFHPTNGAPPTMNGSITCTKCKSVVRYNDGQVTYHKSGHPLSEGRATPQPKLASEGGVTEAMKKAAWDMLCHRLQRNPSTSEEDDTCSLRAAWKAMLAFAFRAAPSSSGDAVERVARAMFAQAYSDATGGAVPSQNDPEWREYESQARAAIAALAPVNHGYAGTPVSFERAPMPAEQVERLRALEEAARISALAPASSEGNAFDEAERELNRENKPTFFYPRPSEAPAQSGTAAWLQEENERLRSTLGRIRDSDPDVDGRQAAGIMRKLAQYALSSAQSEGDSRG